MTRVTVSGATLDLFTGFLKEPGPVEVCDPEGNVLGRFEGSIPHYRTDIQSPISDDELEIRRKEPGGKSLAEFWKEMGRT